MSPTVPLSFFVDPEPLEESPPTEPPVRPADDLVDCGAMSPEELAEQIRVQLEDCRPLSPAELADEQRSREEIRALERVMPARYQQSGADAEAMPRGTRTYRIAKHAQPEPRMAAKDCMGEGVSPAIPVPVPARLLRVQMWRTHACWDTVQTPPRLQERPLQVPRRSQYRTED